MMDKKDQMASLYLETEDSYEATCAVQELVSLFGGEISSEINLNATCIYAITVPGENLQEFLLRATYHALIEKVY
jgi:hypothetical protein